MTEILIEHPAPGVALVRLCAPERKNALTGDSARALRDALASVGSDPDVGAMVLAGVDNAFCAGAHRELLTAVGRGEPQAREDIDVVYDLFEVMRNSPVPIIAAVRGAAVGAGLNLVLAADVRVVAEDAYLRSMFVANGIHPGGAHLKMLDGIGGREATTLLAVLDEPVSGAEFARRGWATEALPAADVEERAVALARRAGRAPSAGPADQGQRGGNRRDALCAGSRLRGTPPGSDVGGRHDLNPEPRQSRHPASPLAQQENTRMAISMEPPGQESVMDDDERLRRLGFNNEFKRDMGPWANFALGFTYLSPVVGIYVTFAFALAAAGPPMVWAWWSPAWADAGRAGLRRNGRAVPRRRRRLPVGSATVGRRWAWMTGWIYMFALFATIAGVAYGACPTSVALFGFNADGLHGARRAGPPGDRHRHQLHRAPGACATSPSSVSAPNSSAPSRSAGGCCSPSAITASTCSSTASVRKAATPPLRVPGRRPDRRLPVLRLRSVW